MWKECLKWFGKNVWDAAAVIGLLLCIAVLFVYVTYRRTLGAIEEGFNTQEGFQETTKKLMGVMSMGMGEDQCPILKKGLEQYKKSINEESDKGNTEMIKSSQVVIDSLQTNYDALHCDEYLRKLESGEITPPKSTQNIYKNLNDIKSITNTALSQLQGLSTIAKDIEKEGSA